MLDKPVTICPCCRQPLPLKDSLHVSLDWNTASRKGVMVDMEPQSAVLLHTLARCSPSTAPYERLFKAMYGRTECRSDDPSSVLKVRVSRLRRIVAPLGLEISNTYGLGYRLHVAD